MSASLIRQRLEGILDFMQPFWEFVNCHMVCFLTDRHWEQYVPNNIRLEIADTDSVTDCIEEVFFRKDRMGPEIQDKFPEFRRFLNQAQSHSLENFHDILTTMSDIHRQVGKNVSQSQISIKEFMSEKKRHEVEITAELVNDLVENCLRQNPRQDIFVVDAGDGKGYLSSRLALQYGHKVLGIDANETNTENAIERSKKLQRAWNGLTERAQLEMSGITPPRRGKKQKKERLPGSQAKRDLETYKTTSKFISTNLDLQQLLSDFFPNSVQNDPDVERTICLTGLHTCGNLAPTCLHVFHTQPQCKILCNIGCCYHLLKEVYSEKEYFGNKTISDMQTETGFPMSEYLKNKRIKLGRNARMLAAQSIHRTIATKDMPSIALFYRALLEVLVCERDPQLRNTIQVGKIRKFNNFQEYLDLCEKKADFNLKEFPPDYIESIEKKYANDKHYLDLFYLLRMTFAPVLESLILLDRLLYLKELGYQQSYLVPVFDAVISPRRFGIIASKK